MFKRICKITFISHGATVYSMGGIVGNNLKYPKINEFGEEELKKVCEYLKKRGVSYDNIYSCPNACCAKSAQVIADIFKQKSQIIDLIPRNFGDWQGKLYSELIDKNKPEVLSETPPNGESLANFNKRVIKVIKNLVTENTGNRIIIVATPEVIQSALANTLKLKPNYQHKILIKTGSLTQISYFKGWSSVIYSDYCPL